MNTKLEELLDVLDPNATFFEVERRSQRALVALSWPDEPFTDPDAFMGFMIEVARTGDRHMLNLNGEVQGHDGEYRGRCIRLLDEIYDSSGFRTAFDAVSNEDGGLYDIVSKFLAQMAGSYVTNEIAARVNIFWDSLSTEERLTAPDSYLVRYGHLLPADLISGSAAVVRARFPEVLKIHVRLLKELYQIRGQ